MARINITLTPDMHNALLKELDRTGVPIAEQIRQLIEAHLQQRGYKLETTKVKWGGKRKPLT
ncbi:MAG: hypothetical protein LCI00_16965 [Chloroflexi bacterium]|nr:hypothetical protein [Chloroflexota bacterium]